MGAHILDETVLRPRDAMDEVRHLSSELWPRALDDLGLIPSVEAHFFNYTVTYENIRLERNLKVTEAEIPTHLKLEIFRVTQEAMLHTAKHANATMAAVSMQNDQGNAM